MNVIHTDNDINIQSKDNVIQPFLKNNIYQITLGAFKNFDFDINHLKVSTDRNLIFSSFEEEIGYKFAPSKETILFWDDHPIIPGAFAQFNFFTSGNSQFYTRIFAKLLELITEVGGFTNGIIFSAQIILFLYSSNIILWHCIFIVLANKEIKERLNGIRIIDIREKNSELNSKLVDVGKLESKKVEDSQIKIKENSINKDNDKDKDNDNDKSNIFKNSRDISKIRENENDISNDKIKLDESKNMKFNTSNNEYSNYDNNRKSSNNLFEIKNIRKKFKVKLNK